MYRPSPLLRNFAGCQLLRVPSCLSLPAGCLVSLEARKEGEQHADPRSASSHVLAGLSLQQGLIAATLFFPTVSAGSGVVALPSP